MFKLKEENLAEMGVNRIGDRLYVVDCLQSLYEELTTWKKAQSDKVRAKVSPTANLLPGAGGADPYKQGGMGQAGGGGRRPTAALQKLLAQVRVVKQCGQ